MPIRTRKNPPKTDRVDDSGIHPMIWEYMAHSIETMRTMPPIEVPRITQDQAERMVRAMHEEHAIEMAVVESRNAIRH